jgi:hypothetical protein
VTALAAASWIQLVPAVLLAANAWALRALVGGPVHVPAGWYRQGWDPVVAVGAAVAVPPAALFAVDMVAGFREGRPPLDDDTWWIDHWPMQAAAALTLVAVAAAVSAGVRGRWSGTPVSAGCVAAAACWFGYWSATYPDHAGSAGRAWGIALVVWGCVFAGLVAWRLVRRPPGPEMLARAVQQG